MNAEIRSPKSEGIFAAGVILILLFCGCNRTSDPSKSGTDPPPIHVAVDRVEACPAVVEQSFIGTVVPLRRTVVASPVEGQVVEFGARKGSFVKTPRNSPEGGNGVVPLRRLRTNEAAIDIAGAVAELEAREHELDELKLSAPRETEQAKARMKAAETVMKLAESRLKCAQELHHQRITSVW
jgi:hypothetical protein